MKKKLLKIALKYKATKDELIGQLDGRLLDMYNESKDKNENNLIETRRKKLKAV